MADVEYRHRTTNAGRFVPNDDDPESGDRLVRVRGRRSYGQARLMEDDLATQYETVIGRDGKDYRGNRQQPLAAERRTQHEALDVTSKCP